MAGVPEPSFLIASGLLGKQEGWAGAYTRYFFYISTAPEPRIGYARNVNEAPLRALSLVGSKITDAGLSFDGIYRFTLVFRSNERWYLCTDSQDDRARWLDIIMRCERAAAFKPPVPSSASDSSRTSSRASRAVRPEGGAGPRAPPRQEHFASHLMRVALASASAPALAQLDALVASFLPYSSGPPGSSAGASSSQTAAASGAASHLAASTAGSGPGAAPAAPAPVQRSQSLAAGLESGHLELLARPGDGDLVVTSIEEQYDRAVQCYERYSPHMPSRQRKELQAWAAAIAASSAALSTGSGSSACGPGPSSFSTSLQLLSAKATFVIEVTRCKQSWAERQQRSAQAAAAAGTAPVEWDAAESDIFASPQEVVRQLQASLAMQAGNGEAIAEPAHASAAGRCSRRGGRPEVRLSCSAPRQGLPGLLQHPLGRPVLPPRGPGAAAAGAALPLAA
ncbi:hypothetical protein V8C86DRAFT_2499568 [Haematococcus lacustris]